MERLSHKDVRQRRRAIRHLFELNDPFALSGFLQFLDSDDQWFVDQSIEAIRRWDNGEKIELLGRLSKHKSSEIRLLSLEIVGRYEDTNNMFEEPKNPDFIVTHFEADMWAYLIKNDIYK